MKDFKTSTTICSYLPTCILKNALCNLTTCMDYLCYLNPSLYLILTSQPFLPFQGYYFTPFQLSSVPLIFLLYQVLLINFPIFFFYLLHFSYKFPPHFFVLLCSQSSLKESPILIHKIFKNCLRLATILKMILRYDTIQRDHLFFCVSKARIHFSPFINSRISSHNDD